MSDSSGDIDVRRAITENWIALMDRIDDLESRLDRLERPEYYAD